MKKIKVPKNVKLIINLLEKNGFEAYAVGGCVRDAVLLRKPNDWDITTSALPEDVKKIFNRTIDTGIKHGTVTVMIEKTGYEVTTYRIDGEYEDGRHPKSVEFTRNLIEDLKRRDFTINAMAYNDRVGIVDEFGGISDLENHLIKCVGNPTDRFNEDALRILRAVRFAAVLGFEIEENTKSAIIELAENLNKISKERIQAELEKLMMSKNPGLLECARQTGITKVIFDEVDRLYGAGMLYKVLKLVNDMPPKHNLRWAGILVMADRQRAAQILKDFKFDNKTVNVVSRIVAAAKRPLPADRAGVRRDIYEIGEDIYEEYLEFMKVYLASELVEKMKGIGEKILADVSSGSGSMENRQENVPYKTIEYDDILNEYKDIIEKKECISYKMLAVNGKDMIELGIERGEKVGDMLSQLLYKVLEDSSLNDRKTLLDFACSVTSRDSR